MIHFNRYVLAVAVLLMSSQAWAEHKKNSFADNVGAKGYTGPVQHVGHANHGGHSSHGHYHGGLNFSVGIVPFYLGGGHYDCGRTTLYHPYRGWYTIGCEPQGLYYRPNACYTDYILPPFHFSSESQYGPQAVREFVGADRELDAGPLVGGDNTFGVVTTPVGRARVVSSKLIEESRRLVQLGDDRFQLGEFPEAQRRYKSATETAPSHAEAYFRYGITLAITGKTAEAAAAFGRGMELDPQWHQGAFRLDQIYGQNALAKNAHFETLASTALQSPQDPLPLLLVGLFLQMDGQTDRAAKFLNKAVDLGGPQLRPKAPAATDGFDL